MNKHIFVKFTQQGFHQWKDAPEHRKYLSTLHRHLFYVEVRCVVYHDDREIEFHDLLDFAKEQFQGGNMNNISCETMAEVLALALVNKYDRDFLVQVSEDNECGASVYMDKDTKVL